MRHVIILLITIVTAYPSFANEFDEPGKHGPKMQRTLEERAESKLEFLSIVLDLTENQLYEIQSLQAEHLASVTVIKELYQPVLDNMKAELKQIRLETDATFTEAREKAKSVRENYDPQLAPMRSALKEEQSSFDKVLAGIFTSEQNEKYTQLKAFKDEKKGQMQHRRDNFLIK